MIWIFGYGSLMWDGWESDFGCTRRVVASLPGFPRTFNKASIERWGTKANPGPTLNLETSSEELCAGVAFAFPASMGAAIRAYLEKREGRGFLLRQHEIIVSCTERVLAFVPIYEGKNLVIGSRDEIAEKACRATGSAGRCVDYVKNLATELERLGISDPAVTALLTAIGKRKREG